MNTISPQNVLTRLDMTRDELSTAGLDGCAEDVAFGMDTIAQLESALYSCLEYLDNYVDVEDGDYGAPNRAMRLVNEINEALGRCVY